MTQPPAGLLQGVRVLDLGIWRPVPYATQLLVELGADVIKVEPPEGDPMRLFPDLFGVLNAGKRAAAIDLKDATARAAVFDLAATADAMVEGFRPGVVARLGLDYARVQAANPAVVYCSVSGYGQTGPLRDLPGHDLNYQARAGLLEPREPGAEPVIARPPLADLAGGGYAALAMCAALVRAGRTGEGEYIDAAMTDVLATWTGPLESLRTSGGATLGGRVVGYGTFRCADGGWIALGVLDEPHLWRALAEALGWPDVVGLSFAERTERFEELTARLRQAIAGRDRATAVALLEAAGVPVAPVLAQPELAGDAQLLARGVVRASGGVMAHPLGYARHPALAPGAVPPLRRGVDQLPAWE